MPTTEAEMKKCIDLLQRTLFYHALDDAFLQKELSNIPECDQSLSKFHDEALKADAKRHHYRDATEKGNVLDASTSVSVNKVDHHDSYRGRGRMHGRGRDSGYTSNHQHSHPSGLKAADTPPPPTHQASGGRGAPNISSSNGRGKRKPIQ